MVHPRFQPIRTPRLVLRPFTLDDVAGLSARRSDPEVARYQNWETPYTLEQAERLASGLLDMDGPQPDAWWMAIVEHADNGETLGDLALHLSGDGHTAEIGYTLESRHWGNGYATEAVAALVEHLFEDLGVTRVFGMLHPDNAASAMVLERTGFLFEGHTRGSFWLGGENSDDWIYGLTRPDWEAWRSRLTSPPDEVRLVEVSAHNQRAVGRLHTHRTQETMVAPMGVSWGDALFPELIDGAPVKPWMRAVEADGELAGFVMVALATEHHPDPYLWRLLIDRRHQRRGIGRRVLDLVVDECRTMGDTALFTSWVEGRGAPEPFYLAYGFQPTGKVEDGEIEGRLEL